MLDNIANTSKIARNKLQEAAALRVERRMYHPELYEEQRNSALQASQYD